jgi:hypothetical protein
MTRRSGQNGYIERKCNAYHVQFRRKICAEVGLGFELTESRPESADVVPNASKILSGRR